LKTASFVITGVLLACPALQANQIPNPDLDQKAQDNLSEWTYSDKRGPKPIAIGRENVNSAGMKVARIEEPAGSGRYFLRLESDGKSGKEYFTINSGRFTVPTGFVYEVSGDYRGQGLLRESGVDRNASAGMLQVRYSGEGKDLMTNTVHMFSNSGEWTELTKVDVSGERKAKIAIPEQADSVQVSVGFSNTWPQNPMRVDFRNIALRPVDYSLPNPSFEQAQADGSPVLWRPYGSARTKIVANPVHGGSKAGEVKDAPISQFSGWSAIVPVRQDREYRLKGYAKAGDLRPGTAIAGGALSIQFLDSKQQPIGQPFYSKTTTTDGEWSELATPKATPPDDAVSARLTAGMIYCAGSCWFDDLSLDMSPVEMANAAKVLRPDPKPTDGTTYATNLLKNGNVESGEKGMPEGWTYVGKSEPDWTDKDLQAIYGNNRPTFGAGRGKGQWSRDIVYQANGALCNISVDPPRATNLMFYGRTPVDGYWFSDPMPCEPGKAYMAGAWLRPGAIIDRAWYGPLELRFFDQAGTAIPTEKGLRTMLGVSPSNEWNYWFSPPFVAPGNAATMRLRFGQEMAADKGGWGATYADNLGVWALPEEANVPESRKILFANPEAANWFAKAHAKTKPPYMPSPEVASEYQSIWGESRNTVPGNIFDDPNGPVKVSFQLFNVLGEDRKVYIKGLRTDWKGTTSDEFTSPAVTIPAYSQAPVEVTLPPMKGYGAFHLECAVMEGNAQVGECDGRYAVVPPQQRKRTQPNIWAVTTQFPIKADNSPEEQELGQVLQRAGFGLTWVREYDNQGLIGEPRGAAARRELKFYRALGMQVVLQLEPPFDNWTPSTDATFDPKPYYEYGQGIAREYKGQAVAYGDWGVEQSNNRTAAQPVYRPIKNGKFLSNREYDLIYQAIHDGIRSVDKETPILIGNTATDRKNQAISRMYEKPVSGRFDGIILNAYFAGLEIAQNALAMFDKHGDTTKTIWQEENSDQRSPNVAPGRRYGEWEGASNLVRSWVGLSCKAYPRIKAITQWGFSPRNRISWVSERSMMDIRMQPRPQFVAHAVMADALADAKYQRELSAPGTTLFEYKRSDGPLFVAWSNAGQSEIKLKTSESGLTVMDIMGNKRLEKAAGGVVTLRLTPTPIYVFGPRQPMTLVAK